jgi:uroporphyrinogen decarboxylase
MPNMTRRENMLRAARRQPHPWITLDFGLSQETLRVFRARVGAQADPCEYFNFDGRWLGPTGTNRPAPDWRGLYYPEGTLPENADIDPEWGTARVHLEHSDDDLSFFPLRGISTVAEVDAYPWPDAGAEYRYQGLAERIRALHDQGFPVFVGAGSFFESVWNLRGFEALMLDMAEGSPVAKRLFHRMAELLVRSSEQVAKSGADLMNTGSDVATQRGPLMSPSMWREYVFPLMRDCIRAAKRIKPDILVLYHSCGNVMDMVDGFIESGIDILDPCQPEAMDIFELKRRYGKALSFHGGIGVQSVLPFGTPQQVRDMVRKTIDAMAAGGGYLCSTSHNLRPEIPWENVMAFVGTVREYGEPPARP